MSYIVSPSNIFFLIYNRPVSMFVFYLSIYLFIYITLSFLLFLYASIVFKVENVYDIKSFILITNSLLLSLCIYSRNLCWMKLFPPKSKVLANYNECFFTTALPPIESNLQIIETAPNVPIKFYF